MIGTFDKIWRAMRLAQNRTIGYWGESIAMVHLMLNGYTDIKKIHKGADFKARKYDLFTGRKGPWEYFEVKTGPHAKLSKLQKQMKRRYGRRYHVIRQ